MDQYKDLNIWKRAVRLAAEIYKVSACFPKEEKFGLTSQIRRCVVSMSSNIAEGAGRNSNKSFRHFLNIAYGSVCELETQIIVANNLNFTHESESKEILNEIDEIQKMIYTFSKTLKV